MTASSSLSVGFIGLGRMGSPTALNLVRAGIHLRVWNRDAAKTWPLVAAGASAAATVDELMQAGDLVFLMVTDDEAVDRILGRGTQEFTERVRGTIVVPMGAHSPDWSVTLRSEIVVAGGSLVEAPVSRSRIPAESGSLVDLVGPNNAATVTKARKLAPVYVADVGAT